MQFSRHSHAHIAKSKILITALLLLSLSPSAYSQFKSCELMKTNPYMQINSGPDICGHPENFSSASFNPCILKAHTAKIHHRIQEDLKRQCAIEKEVERISNEQKRIEAQGSGEPMPQIPQEFHDEIARIYGTSATHMQAERSDNCLTKRFQRNLMAATKKKCLREIQLIAPCMQAGVKASANSQGIGNKHSESISSKKGLSAVFDRIGKTQKELDDLVAANKACVDAIVSATKMCRTIFTDYFSDQSEEETLARYCTHNGIMRDEAEYIQFMSNDGPVAKFQALTKKHIENRKIENKIACNLELMGLEISSVVQTDKNSNSQKKLASVRSNSCD